MKVSQNMEQAINAVKLGMDVGKAAAKYDVKMEDLNKELAAALNGGKAEEIGDHIEITTRKDGTVKRTKEANSDGTSTITKYNDDGSVKSSRVSFVSAEYFFVAEDFSFSRTCCSSSG